MLTEDLPRFAGYLPLSEPTCNLRVGWLRCITGLLILPQAGLQDNSDT